MKWYSSKRVNKFLVKMLIRSCFMGWSNKDISELIYSHLFCKLAHFSLMVKKIIISEMIQLTKKSN
jgi:hypothetical protein